MILPKISIIIPVKSGASAGSAINAIKRATYPPELLEIILVEGDQPARQRNDGCKIARGEILYFLDNDSQIKKNALQILAQAFVNKKHVVVGGPSITLSEPGNYFGKLVGLVLETQFGALRMRYRYSSKKAPKITTEYHLIGANLAIRSRIYKHNAGFDEHFYPNEETELLRRLQNSGYTLTYTKKLVVYRSHRKNPRELLRQFYHYGRGRMMQITKSPRIEDLSFALPPLFGLYLFSLPFSSSIYYVVPLGVYVLFCYLTALKATIKYRRLDLLITMPLLFPIIHLSYAWGLVMQGIQTIISPLLPSKANYTRIKIARVKLFNGPFRSV